MGDAEDVSDLLPDDQELCQRTSRWNDLFSKYKEDEENEKKDLLLDSLKYIASDNEDDEDKEENESIEPSQFEDNREDSDFDVKDYLNATQKVIAKRKEGWCRTGIDRLLENSFNGEIVEKVGGWLQNNCDYFSTEFSRDMNKQCFNEIKINERNIVLERNIDNESDDSSVDTAKYILSNRKNRKSRVTMTIKQFCYTTQKRDHPPMPSGIKEKADSRRLMHCNNVETPSTMLDKNYFSHMPKRCIPLQLTNSHKSRRKSSPPRNEDRTHRNHRSTPRKRPIAPSASDSQSESYQPHYKTLRYMQGKSTTQKKPENIRLFPLKRAKSTKHQKHLNPSDVSYSSSDSYPQKKTSNYANMLEKSVSSSPLKRITSTRRRPQEFNRSRQFSSTDDSSSVVTAVRRAHKELRKPTKNSHKTSRSISSDSDNTIENKFKNQPETCSMSRKGIRRSSEQTTNARLQDERMAKDQPKSTKNSQNTTSPIILSDSESAIENKCKNQQDTCSVRRKEIRRSPEKMIETRLQDEGMDKDHRKPTKNTQKSISRSNLSDSESTIENKCKNQQKTCSVRRKEIQRCPEKMIKARPQEEEMDKDHRKPTKNSQKPMSRAILSDSESTIENNCKNQQDTCSVKRKQIQRSPEKMIKARPQEEEMDKDHRKPTKNSQKSMSRAILSDSESTIENKCINQQETAKRKEIRKTLQTRPQEKKIKNDHRRPTKNSQKPTSLINLSDSERQIENNCNNQLESCSAKQKEFRRSSKKSVKSRQQEESMDKISTNDEELGNVLPLKQLEVKCMRLDMRMLSKAKSEASYPKSDRIHDTTFASKRTPSDLDLTNVGIINSTAIQSQESMFMCKKNFQSICNNSPKRSSVVRNKSVDKTAENNNNDSSIASRGNSTTTPILLYSPFMEKSPMTPTKNGQVKFTHNDIDRLIGADMRKKCLGNRTNFQINAKSELLYIPPAKVVEVSDSDSDSETDDLETLCFNHNGKILEVVNL